MNRKQKIILALILAGLAWCLVFLSYMLVVGIQQRWVDRPPRYELEPTGSGLATISEPKKKDKKERTREEYIEHMRQQREDFMSLGTFN